MQTTKPREALLRALNAQRYVAPNGGGPTEADLHAAIDAGKSDSLERLPTFLCPPDGRLIPVEPRAHRKFREVSPGTFHYRKEAGYPLAGFVLVVCSAGMVGMVVMALARMIH